jgi:elongation factor 1-beta
VKSQYGDAVYAANSEDHTNAQNAVSKDHKIRWGCKIELAKVLVSLKIFPEDITIDLDQLKQKIEKIIPPDSKVLRFNEEPIAFGLKALIAHILIPEERQEELEKIETNIREIQGVSNIETFMMQRW